MTDINIIFCRNLLKNVRNDLKKKMGTKKYTELMKYFCVHRYDDGSTEIHVNKCEMFPDGYFQTLKKTDNMYHAKAEGLSHIYEILFPEEA